MDNIEKNIGFMQKLYIPPEGSIDNSEIAFDLAENIKETSYFKKDLTAKRISEENNRLRGFIKNADK